MSKEYRQRGRRQRRRRWVMQEFGDGETVNCHRCGVVLTFETMTMDRYPIRGCDGGEYEKGNIQPACAPCNKLDGSEAQCLREHGPGCTKPHRWRNKKLTYTIAEVVDGAVTEFLGYRVHSPSEAVKVRENSTTDVNMEVSV